MSKWKFQFGRCPACRNGALIAVTLKAGGALRVKCDECSALLGSPACTVREPHQDVVPAPEALPLDAGWAPKGFVRA